MQTKIKKFSEMSREEVAELNACGRYLMVGVLRPASGKDFSMRGVSSRHTNLFVPHPEGWMELDRIEPELVMDVLPAAFAGCPPRLKPRILAGNTMAMSGGNYVESSDSRFSELYGAPLSIHDRVEN